MTVRTMECERVVSGFKGVGWSVIILMVLGCSGGGSDEGAAPAPSPATTGSVTFAWDANTDTDVAGYRVYRSTTSGNYGAPIATLDPSTTSFQSTNLGKGATYFFVVSAFDGNGNESPFSNEVRQSIP